MTGLPLVPVSVNFARQDFDHADMVTELNRIVDSYEIGRYGIGNAFIIEITEQDRNGFMSSWLRSAAVASGSGWMTSGALIPP